MEDAVILGLIEETLDRSRAPGFVLDGFPRTDGPGPGAGRDAGQAGGRPGPGGALSPLRYDEEVMKRTCRSGAGGRHGPETVRHRLEVYAEQHQAPDRVLRAQGKLRRVDGVGEIPEIRERIEAALERLIGVTMVKLRSTEEIEKIRTRRRSSIGGEVLQLLKGVRTRPGDDHPGAGPAGRDLYPDQRRDAQLSWGTWGIRPASASR